MRHLRGSRGQVLPITGLAIGVLVGAVALSADVSVLYSNWSRMRGAVDAAALAGAAFLPDAPGQAVSSASSYAIQNGMQAGEVSSTAVAADNKSLTVQLARNVPMHFARYFGLTTALVKVQATAGVQPVSGVWGAIPVALDYNNWKTYHYGQKVSLPGGGYAPGNWGPLELGGTGPANYQSKLVSGYQTKLNVGDYVPAATDGYESATQNGLSQRISSGKTQNPSATFSSHPLNDPRMVTMPLVLWNESGNNPPVPIKAFVELWIESINGTTIKGEFIRQTAVGTPDGSSSDTGVYRALLLQ